MIPEAAADIESSRIGKLQDNLSTTLKFISAHLSSFGMPPLGDVFSSQADDINQTVTTIYNLILTHQRDLTFKAEAFSKFERIDKEKRDLSQQLNKAHEQIETLQGEIAKLQNASKSAALKGRQEREKISAERDDLKRELSKLSHKEAQFQHELKKREVAQNKLQEQLRKALGEKDLAVSNSMETTEALRERTGIYKGGDVEFSLMIAKGYEENQNRLLNENIELRNAFDLLQRELFEIIKQRREAFSRRQALEQQEEPDYGDFELNRIRSEMFSMPFESVSETVVQTFQENIRKFKEYLDISGDEDDPKKEETGPKALTELKHLMGNYQTFIQNQENFMQKAVFGSRKLAADPVNISRLLLTNEREIENAKTFLQKEFSSLEKTQKELEADRALVTDTARQLDSEKVKISAERDQLYDEIKRWTLALERAKTMTSEA
eukprot:CAMPEP_0204905296 /NCGR_PEP_ID=MMETSP1397-20131031/5344_1 /ASSEMBLY_ACC=CAM_ASM_000891 /TAXON_ID=49980 /ORGANISM="Climacostomum Climacostomum virens, Strain Stock W-24" /LENGTH=437 /DNA_ID=CAMNT_0052074167 /DNA_START=1132 /DNA_END=2448 /DNA_ORIENTATION=-